MPLSQKQDTGIEAYVKTALARKVPEDRIRKKLSDAGWSKAAIDRVFGTLKRGAEVKKGTPMLKLARVNKSFGSKTILKDVELKVNEGEIFGIIGLSGSGKTTLLNTIIGFLRPDQGEVLFSNPSTGSLASVYRFQKEVTRIFGFAPQDPSFYSRLTCEENLDHFGSLYGIPSKVRKTNLDSLLCLVELDSARKTLGKNLSGGMQRRLGVACSLIHNPRLLILDEPTADLDPIMRKEIWELIRKINAEGTTVLITSHFLSEMEGLCSRIAILHDSRIVDSGTTDELKDRFSTNYEIHLELATNDYSGIIKELQKKESSISKISHEGHKLVIFTPKSERVLHTLIHVVEKSGEKLLDIDLNKPSLKEVFESYVSRKA